MPEETSVLLYNGKVEGICFANLTNQITANIPLVGIRKGHRHKGFGEYLLRNSVHRIIQKIISGQLVLKEVNATVETENFPALRMYRKIGFREDHSYAHAYLKR